MTGKQKDTSLRNAEYYDMIPTFDKLYNQSIHNITFDDLMPLITSENNIRLAYRNIKNNAGSLTSGIDRKTIMYIKKMNLKKFIRLIQDCFKNCQPKQIRRVMIPKSNGKERPLGIPTIIDRIMQQCILQILEPIMEAKFHKNSNGFRPYKSAESAISQFTNYVYRNKCYYVVDLDIKSFFDNVDHGKLIKQLWALGVQDKKLLTIISLMLKAEIKGIGKPTKGTPQGGILSPLLANIVLNEFDWWLSNQWMTYKTKKKFKEYVKENGNVCSNERKWLRKNTNLKEFYFVRYADDAKIICKSYNDAVKLKIASTMWLKERLGLEVSEEKTKIVNLKKNYSNFLGFKIKVRKKNKNGRYTIISHMSNKARKRVKDSAKEKLKDIQKSKTIKEINKNIDSYNLFVIGVHNYYDKATFISIDFNKISKEIFNALHKTLKTTIELSIPNKLNNGFIENKYGKSKMIKYIGEKPIVPISYVRYKKPMQRSNKVNKYTAIGREEIHTNLECMEHKTIKSILKHPYYDKTVEFNDVIIPKCASQYGKCYVSKKTITHENIDYIYKNDKLKEKDNYQNIIVIDREIKNLLLSEGCGIMKLKEKIYKKERRTIG